MGDHGKRRSLREFFCLFVYFWPHWIFIASCRLSLVRASRATLSLCVDLLLPWLLLLWNTGFGVHGLSCLVACGIFLDQGWNLYPLPWQVGSEPWTTREVPREFF